MRLVDLYAGALAVVFPPFDEDYGYVTLEAFLAHKPVVTTTDAGGPLEFVEDGVTGFVAEPTPEALGAAIDASGRRPCARTCARRRRRTSARGRSPGTASSIDSWLSADGSTDGGTMPRRAGRPRSSSPRSTKRRRSPASSPTCAPRRLARDRSSSTMGRATTPARERHDAGARVIRHPYNKGNGAAVKTGIRQATGTFVLIVDGDGQHRAGRRRAPRGRTSTRTILSSAHARRADAGKRRAARRQRGAELDRQLPDRTADSRSHLGVPRRPPRVPASSSCTCCRTASPRRRRRRWRS